MRRSNTSLPDRFLSLQKRFWTLLVLAAPLLPVLPATASADCNFDPLCNPLFFVCCALDKEGTGGSCNFQCPITEVHFVDYTPGTLTSRYEFRGQSSYSTSGSAACPPEIKRVKGVATWQQDQGLLSGIAKEEIFWEAPFVSGGWTRLVSTTSRCTTNPWLSENATCQLISKEPATSSFPKPYPRSARIVSETMRQALLLAAFPAEPPTIGSPQPSAVIKDGKVVFTAHKFVPDHPSVGTPQVEVQFEIPVWPGTTGGEKITHLVNLNNNSVTKLVELTPGSWLVKARVKSPAGDSPWTLQSNLEVPSFPTNFKIKQKKMEIKRVQSMMIKPDASKQ